MKKLIVFSLVMAVSLPLWAETKTTTTRTYDSETTVPLDSEIEAQEDVSYDQQWEAERMEENRLEEQRMEEARLREIEREDAIDYNDRTRTDRARHALNTSSHASDDQ